MLLGGNNSSLQLRLCITTLYQMSFMFTIENACSSNILLKIQDSDFRPREFINSVALVKLYKIKWKICIIDVA